MAIYMNQHNVRKLVRLLTNRLYLFDDMQVILCLIREQIQ